MRSAESAVVVQALDRVEQHVGLRATTTIRHGCNFSDCDHRRSPGVQTVTEPPKRVRRRRVCCSSIGGISLGAGGAGGM